LEPRATNALDRRPVAVAAVSEPGADAVQAILPAREPRLIGAHVLDEQKATSGLQHATKLPQRPRLVVHRAKDEGRDGDVEALVLEGQVLGRRTEEERRGRALAEPPLQSAHHGRFRLGERERLDTVAVEGEIGAGTAA